MSRIGSWMELEPSSHIYNTLELRFLLQPSQRKFIYSESPSQLAKYISGKIMISYLRCSGNLSVLDK